MTRQAETIDEAMPDAAPERIDEVALHQFLRALRPDLAEADLTASEARYLVDTYYLWQDSRKRAANQLRAMREAKPEEPARAIVTLMTVGRGVEEAIRRALTRYSTQSPVGRWSQSITGIAGVLSAGLLCHIDIHKAPTVGHIRSFGGWNPQQVWKPGERRPYNARLKTLFWKIGDSFVKTKGHASSMYGPFYDEAKARYVAMNEAKVYADTAAATLAARPTHKQAARYREGRLPDGRIDLRARRVAVTIFLDHWHQVAYWLAFHRLAPAPYPIALLGHAHEIPVPNADLVEGFIPAMRAVGRWPG